MVLQDKQREKWGEKTSTELWTLIYEEMIHQKIIGNAASFQ